MIGYIYMHKVKTLSFHLFHLIHSVDMNGSLQEAGKSDRSGDQLTATGTQGDGPKLCPLKKNYFTPVTQSCK